MKLKKGKFLGAIILSVFLLSSCIASRSKDALFTNSADHILDTLKTVHVMNDKGQDEVIYKIKPADLITVRNLQNIEFGVQQAQSGSSVASAPTFYVESDGTVMLPVIGKVALAGLSRREAANKLQTLYSQKLLKDPIIDLSIVNLKVNVLGEVRRPGKYLLESDNITLTDIIGEASGFSEFGDPGNIRIIRGEKINPEVIYVNLKDIRTLSHKKLILQNNDIIYVEAKRSSVERTQKTMTLLQPALMLINLGVLIYNLGR